MTTENLIPEESEIEIQAVETKAKPYSGRKTFAFSDEKVFTEVEEILAQKPENLTNGEFLHQALKLYLETDELNQTFNHLPAPVVDIFKGDLEKLNVLFEGIRETFKTQMTSNAFMIQQQSDRLTRQFDREREALEQRMNQLEAELQRAIAQKEVAEQEIDQLKPAQAEVAELKGTLSALQQALVSEQERVTGLQRELNRCNVEDYEALQKSYQDLKELFATNNIRMQHLETQYAQQEQLLVREREQAQHQQELAQANEQALKQELKELREELSTANKTVQELYQKLLKA